MRTSLTVAAATVLVTLALPAQAQQALPVPGVQPARDVPGAKELPDSGVTHKVVFDVVAAPANVDDVNPALNGVARYLNTLAKHGVPPEHRQIAVVLHREATDIILQSAAFKARHDGHDNPNIALIRTLAQAGVNFHVCGQAVLGRDIDPRSILPEIQLDLWALTTLLNLQRDGYVKVGG